MSDTVRERTPSGSRPGGREPAPSAAGLQVEGVTVRVERSTLLEDVTFDVPAASFTALLGPNGAGKSTLLRAISGVEPPTAGRIRFAADDLLALSRRERARRVALVEQDATTDLAVTVRDVARLGRTPHESWLGGGDRDGDGVVEDALLRSGAAPLAERIVPSLSGGERQRSFLARSLAQEPRLLILDEPTNHLDVAAQLEVLALLQQLTREGVTVVAALHDLSLAAAHAESVVVLDDGHVAASGATQETLTPGLIRRVYGVEARWLENPLTHRPLLAVARAETSPPTE